MTRHTSPAPFSTEYEPFAGHDGSEIPSFRIYDANSDVVAETDSGKPWEQQEADALLFAAAPALRDALKRQTAAAQAVINAWEKGDLAGAVRMLDAAIPAARAAIARA